MNMLIFCCTGIAIALQQQYEHHITSQRQTKRSPGSCCFVADEKNTHRACIH